MSDPQFEPFSVEFHPTAEPKILRIVVMAPNAEGNRVVKYIFEGEARWLRHELRRELAKMLPEVHADMGKR